MDLQIILGKTAGFCFGVKNAVNKALEATKNETSMQCLGELVHNKQVTEELEKKGIQFIENLEQANKKLIIRSHGVEKEVYLKAKEKGIEIIDLTCPKVLNIHKIAEEYIKKGYYIFLVGQKEHPETIGTMSFCGPDYSLIQSEEDVEEAVKKYKNSGCANSLLISQTTYSLEKFNKISHILNQNVPNIEVKNTICNATKLRQEETQKIAKQVDLMIIVGGKHSSNSNKLYEIAKKYCRNTIFIEIKEEIDINYIKKFERIGVMAGASTPQKSIIELVDIIQKTC